MQNVGGNPGHRFAALQHLESAGSGDHLRPDKAVVNMVFGRHNGIDVRQGIKQLQKLNPTNSASCVAMLRHISPIDAPVFWAMTGISADRWETTDRRSFTLGQTRQDKHRSMLDIAGVYERLLGKLDKDMRQA